MPAPVKSKKPDPWDKQEPVYAALLKCPKCGKKHWPFDGTQEAADWQRTHPALMRVRYNVG